MWASTHSAPVSASNGGHHVQIQATVFTGSVWATVNSNVGAFTNVAELDDTAGGAVAQQIVGTNTVNGNLVLLAPFFTTVTHGEGSITSN